jgi:Kef-type K+ transport system membrane component KefB
VEVTPIKTAKTGLAGFAVAAAVMLALGGCSPGAGTDDIGRVMLALLVALVAAKLGGELFVRIGQPVVLGELVFGIVVGNLSLAGYHGLDFIAHDRPIQALAEIGIALLLFQVGLESDIHKMRQVGASSLLAAVLGVSGSFLLGWTATAIFLPHAGTYVQVFVAVVIASSSIGIAARVFLDLGRLQTREARTVLGAAVIDDVIGLVALTIMAGVISTAGSGTAGVSAASVLLVIAKAVLFLLGTLIIGRWLSPRLFHLASRMKGTDLLLAVSLGFCFGFGYLAQVIGLAPIIGAFAAGLTLEEVHWRSFAARGEHSVLELIKPIVGFLAPVFFFRTGALVDLRVFANPSSWAFAGALAAAAVLGKQLCGLGVLQRGISRLSVGIGMIPRGEVVLIAAAIGAKLMLDGKPVVTPNIYSAVVFVVVFTTLITPPLLKWSLSRSDRRREHS